MDCQGGLFVGTDKTIDDCAQYCKSISNKFSFNQQGSCYCETSTRDEGRCEVEERADNNLYEINYAGT